jgi:tRNA threonylcarbamoyladenosine biosynthesis protein TsaB
LRPGQKPVLAIDTALGACAAAVFDAGLGQTLAVESIRMERGHAEALLPLIERVMQQSGIAWDDLDRIVTTVGPGSFTGLRVGIAAARGIGLACDKPVVGVSTLDALTAPYVTETETVPIVAAIDARHGNFYLQMIGAGGRKLISPRVMSTEDAMRSIAIGLVRLIGSGADAIAALWPTPDIPAPLLVDSASGARYSLGRAPRRQNRSGQFPAEAALSARAGRKAAGRASTAAPMMAAIRSFFRRPDPAISDARADDAAALARVHASAFRHGWSENEFERLLADKNVICHVARENGGAGEVCAFTISRIVEDEAEILMVAVEPGEQGRGLAGTAACAASGAHRRARRAQGFSGSR